MVLKRTSYGWVQLIPMALEMLNPKPIAPIAGASSSESSTGLYVVGGLAAVALIGGIIYLGVKE